MSEGPGRDLGSSALRAVSQLVGLQIFSRGFTFALNQALVRVASPEVFGTATIQFELLLSTILFLSREGVRNALLRTTSPSSSSQNTPNVEGEKNRKHKIANVAIIPILIGAPLSIAAALGYFYLASESTRSQPHFSLAIALYAFAAFLELVSEPLYIRALSELKVNVRVRSEAAAVAAKALTSVILLVSMKSNWSLVAFAGGQVAYGAAVLGVFLWEYGKSSRILLHKVTEKVHGNIRNSYFDQELLQLSVSMTSQSVFKHFLTEGDRFLVSKFSQLKDQGGYAIATNYGSLVARIIFQPIEETSRIFFSKLLSQSKSRSEQDKVTSNPADLKQASEIIHLVLLLYVHLGVLFLAFGPPYIPTLLSLVLPSRYLSTSAPAVLKAYCLYLPVMALNGFLEALLSSTATPADLARQSRFMGMCSVGFVLVAVGLGEGLGMRETGLVYANVANLGARAAYGWMFTKEYFKRQTAGREEYIGVDGRKCVPPRAVWGMTAVSAVVVRLSATGYGSPSESLKGKVVHIVVGGTMFVSWAAICWLSERQLLRGLGGFFRSRKNSA